MTRCRRRLFYVLVYNILQILLLRLYARRHRPTAAVETTVDDSSVTNDAPAVAQFVDPLDGLDDSTKTTFRVCSKL